MELDHYTRRVQEQLAAAAALGDDRTREIADGLATAAAPAVRVAIMAALAAAADELTVALLDAPGAPRVSVRLDGDSVRVEAHSSEPPEAASPRTDEGEASARISLRLSEALKADVEQAAGREGISVNTWLVRAAGSALTQAGSRSGWPESGGRHGGSSSRVTGWING